MRQSNNESMRRLLGSGDVTPPGSLDVGLARYLEGGLIKGPRQSVLSAESYKGASAEPPSRFHDCTAFETFVNKIHVDDWCSDALLELPLERKLGHVFLLADLVGKMASKYKVSITAIISVDAETNDIVFRFHSEHPGEPAYLDDPEELSEAIAVRTYAHGENH